ncbi:MAG: TadE family protein, partial [Aggregatilineales bacterium]
NLIRPRTRGQSLVELAFTAPLLFLMIVSMAEVAYVANNYLILVDAVRQGARFAVSATPLNWNDGDTRNYLRTACFNQTDWTNSSHTKWAPTGHYNLFNNQIPANGIAYPNLTSLPAVTLHYWTPDNSHPELWPAPDAPKGLFDGVACNTIASMQPLNFDITYHTPGQNSPTINYDDIAVSVVSYVAISGQVSITGRWPISNRECGTPQAGPIASTGPMSDGRDPFFYSGNPLPNPYPLYNPGFGQVRGFILTGNMLATDSAGNVDSTCYGSSFTVDGADPNRNLTTILNQLPDSSIQKNVTNGAMALVEATWTHHQLFGFPPLSALGSPTLYVWSVFPVSGAIPTPTPPPVQTPGEFSFAPPVQQG